MSFVTSGHFTAYIDAFDPDMPVVEIKMTSPIYTDKANGWRRELADDMRKLENGIADYIRSVKSLREEERAYAL